MQNKICYNKLNKKGGLKMKKFCLLILGFFLVFSFSCKKSSKEVTFDVKQEFSNIQKQWTELMSIREEILAVKGKINILEDFKNNPKKYKKEELPQETIETLTANLDELKKIKYEPKYNSFMDNLTIFLDKTLNDEKLKNEPEVLKAVRLYSDECILTGEEFIKEGGKYKEAIDIYNQALSLDPNYELLKTKIKEAEDFRFIKKERFDQVKNGMTMEEVKAICGYPNVSYIQEKEHKGKKIIAWYYPKEGQKAAGIFFSNGKVYNKYWEEKK